MLSMVLPPATFVFKQFECEISFSWNAEVYERFRSGGYQPQYYNVPQRGVVRKANPRRESQKLRSCIGFCLRTSAHRALSRRQEPIRSRRTGAITPHHRHSGYVGDVLICDPDLLVLPSALRLLCRFRIAGLGIRPCASGDSVRVLRTTPL
jgi:hypothetical protein